MAWFELMTQGPPDRAAQAGQTLDAAQRPWLNDTHALIRVLLDAMYVLYQIQVQGLLHDLRSRMRERAMRRGELAQRSGCNIETVRFYEKQGLLPAPPRTAGGHRDYDREHLKRLTFVRRSRELGFTLDQVRGLLRLVDGGEWTCAEVKAMTVEHSAEVRRKIADLEKLAQVLEDMAAHCDGGAVPQCPIVDALMEDADRLPPLGRDENAGRWTTSQDVLS